MQPEDAQWMQAALHQAHVAARAGEVPVGAVVVRHGEIVGVGFNQPVGLHDPSAHAEIQALRDAARRVGNYRLDDCTLYVTLEPCAMCAGAVLHARVARVVWGAPEPRTGAGGSVLNVFGQAALNHQTRVTHGVLADDAAALLTTFFGQRRTDQQQLAKASHPLRDDALRTPEKCFGEDLDCECGSHFYSDWPALDGLRVHVKDSAAGEGAAAPVATRQWLMLPSMPAHQGLFRHSATSLQSRGERVVVPDWLGMGRSDKPKKASLLGDAQQLALLKDLIDQLALGRTTPLVMVAHGDASRLALALLPHLEQHLGTSVGLWLINPLLNGHASKAYLQWLQDVQRKPLLDIATALHGSAWGGTGDTGDADAAQWAAQFPDKGFRAGLRAWAADAQTWVQGPSPVAQAAHRTRVLVSWGQGASWWPAPTVDLQETVAEMSDADKKRWLPQVSGGAVAQHLCSGGDWLPLQNPQALLQASRFFDEL